MSDETPAGDARAENVSREVTVEKLARALARHRNVRWSRLTPDQRDTWRTQVDQLLTYVESTAFFGFLSATSAENGN